MSATIYDIARRCNCTSATVSKVINNKGSISESKKALILQTIKDLGYVPNSAAKNLVTKKSNLIGVVLHNLENRGITHELFSKILNSFRITMEENGYDVVFLAQSNSTNGTILQRSRSRQLDGIFCLCCNFYSEELQEVLDSNIPVVSFDTDKGKLSVSTDSEESVAQMVDYLVSQGHERIVYILPSTADVSLSRLNGFKLGLARNGVEFKDAMVQKGAYFQENSSNFATSNALNSGIKPTAIMYPDDYTAIEAIRSLREFGLKVPQDISITGYDGINLSKSIHPRLTTVEQDSDAIGRKAASLLLNRINKVDEDEHHIKLMAKIYKGSTVKKIK